MVHQTLRILADILVFLILLFSPVLWIIFTDRFRRPPDPEQYAGLFALGALVGILLFIPVISIIAATALVALGGAWLSARYALSAVSYERTLSPARLFPGDEADLTIRVTNRKILPLAWFTVTDPIRFGSLRTVKGLRDRILISGGIEQQEDLGHALVNQAAIGPFQSLLRTYRVKGLRRGVYRLGPATAASGDPFGVFHREAMLASRIEIIVYPQVYTPDEIELPFQQAMGEFRVRRALFEDPTLLAGSREYRPGDPLRRMHWKATARTGELQVKMFDPSTTAQLMIVVNLNIYDNVWQGVELERMESAIDVGASIAVWGLGKGFAVGMRTNGLILGENLMENASRVAPSASPKQAATLLEHLARVTFSGLTSAQQVLADEAHRLHAGTSLIFVTPVLTKELIQVLTSRHLAGRVTTVFCGRVAPVVPGLTLHLIAPPVGPGRAVS